MSKVKVKLARKVLEANDTIASEVRSSLASAHVFALNVMGSPGSGKTELICAAAASDPVLATSCAVIEGDVESAIDGERIAQAGLEVIQINTGGACHLSASMIRDALADLVLSSLDLIIIENVGNLVCPASFDLGEDERLVCTAVTEGFDKPTKYPGMYAKAHALAVTKCDLAEAVEVDPHEIAGRARRVNPKLDVFFTSARTSAGIPKLIDRLHAAILSKKKA